MAAITRRGFDDLRDEALKRAGYESSTGATAFQGRMEYFILAAYLDICHSIHHYELDVIDSSLVLSTSNNYVDFTGLSPKVHVVVSFTIGDVSTGDLIRALVPTRFQQALYGQDLTAGEPTQRARFKERLYFDKIPDAAYKSVIYYYSEPPLPDFAVDSPAISHVWDEHIIEGAVAKANRAVWDPETTVRQGELLSDWLQRAPEMHLREYPIHDKQASEGGHDQIGGPKG
jgi:hypothetical protein